MNRSFLFFCALIFLLSVKGTGQSFFYIETNLGQKDNYPVTYYLLLNVEADGSATARIRYIKADTGEKLFVEQKFIELVDTARLVEDDANKKLAAGGAPIFLGETADPGFMQIRIVCEKMTDSLGTFYEPAGIEYKSNNNTWLAAETKTIEQKTLDELAKNKSFTEVFYPPGDILHSYIFDFKTRGLNSAELKTKFHFIGVANTNDSKIGFSTDKDLNKVMSLLQTMTEQLGIRFLPTIVRGFDFTKKNVENVVDTLAIAAGDIVVFYYSGHGFRYPNDKSDFPRVSMRLNPLQKIDDNNLEIEEIYNRLLKKRARFTLVISDCCNETIDAPIPFGFNFFRTRSAGTAKRLNVENWKALFFPKNSSSILIGSAEKNQLAVCSKELGGFYTNFFVAGLEKSLFTNKTGAPNWWEILNTARENTRWKSLSAYCGDNLERRCVQTTALKVLVSR